jgi:hypothetical protein
MRRELMALKDALHYRRLTPAAVASIRPIDLWLVPAANQVPDRSLLYGGRWQLRLAGFSRLSRVRAATPSR